MVDVEDEREFSYDETSETGPSNWGKIHPEWHSCNSGEMQSPIDLHNKRVQIVSHLGKLDRNYKPANATFVNRGHDMMVRKVVASVVLHQSRQNYSVASNYFQFFFKSRF